jgi:type 1 glutamine amidotransferase
VLVVTGALACSVDGGSEDGELPVFTGPFGGSGGGGQASGNAGAGGNPGVQAGVQGIPAQNGALPLAPGGSAVPANNGVTGQPPALEPDPPVLENVLVFSRTLSYRHDSIPVGAEAIRTLGSQNGFAVQQTEDPTLFNDEILAGFDVVVWLSTTADVLDETQQAAFERYIQAGGAWVGVHAAADTEYDWPWYGQLLGGGAYFVSHPEIQSARLNVEDAEHASAAHLPPDFELTDEWYNFRTNPRSAVSVVMTLDEGSYAPGVDAMGADHPIAWYHEFEGGRAWYTALGHRSELYADPLFTQHLLGGIRWAAGVAP